ncbi:hypothetical protein RHMOL_Rhmol13G0226200 [Rhododendron molle]|uniref:Uncharacterized protein n=1 Tax=Rhododendron molle TaxID=49168 RepID=A0ACC0L9J0_RHOML|nr:hypothetical protein RHMOL_Rhmol13G0226200 [Rhododendron molle]
MERPALSLSLSPVYRGWFSVQILGGIARFNFGGEIRVLCVSVQSMDGGGEGIDYSEEGEEEEEEVWSVKPKKQIPIRYTYTAGEGNCGLVGSCGDGVSYFNVSWNSGNGVPWNSGDAVSWNSGDLVSDQFPVGLRVAIKLEKKRADRKLKELTEKVAMLIQLWVFLSSLQADL